MSLSGGGGNEVEMAAIRTEVSSGTVLENSGVLEASEDREIHGVYLKNNEANCTSELSFSSSMLLDQDAQDEISSGVLAVTNSGATSTIDMPDSAAPIWQAGEEISVHVDNQGSGSALTFVIVYYRPIGDFQRERLRNR